MARSSRKRPARPRPPAADPRVAALLQGDPREFVAARAALARALADGGDADAAARVRGLRRPTVALWLLNRLAVEAAGEVERLLAAGEELRRAQTRAVRGEPEALRAASAELQAALAALVRRGEAIAAAAGHGAGAGLQLQVERALRTVAGGDAEARAALRAGALERSPDAPGVDLLAGLATVPPPAVRAAPPPVPATRRQRAPAAPGERKKAPSARPEAERVAGSRDAEGRREADAAVTQAIRELEDAERRVADARARLAAARRARDRLR